MFRVMKVGGYVTVDDGGNYVTFHGLNVRIKIKTIKKAQLDSVSNRELKRGLNCTAVLLFLLLSGKCQWPPCGNQSGQQNKIMLFSGLFIF